MKSWQSVQLNEVCVPADRFVTPIVGQIYRQLGVRLWGQGAYEREPIDGADTKYAFLNRVEADDLVVNKIWARNGSVAVATTYHSGTFVSTEFPTFWIDRSRVDPGWMRLITKWRDFWSLCDEKSQGTSGKNRIKPKQFLSIAIPLPPLADQQAIVRQFGALADHVREVNEHLDDIEQDGDRLLAVRFHEATAGAPLRPMAEIAPLIRREASIKVDGTYPELGIRSFGKGTFHKPVLSGADVGTKRLFCIEPGDLVFSNVFAWEGAIAIAQPEDLGRFGSHRFISCRADTDVTTAKFLRYYFFTDRGLEKIREASPGGAGRNRTLGLKKLMAIQVPIPPLATQRAFDALQDKVASLKGHHTAIRHTNEALIPAVLERLFANAA